MERSIYAGHRFPPEIIEHAVWLYLRFCLSYRDVEDILARRGIDVTYETVRRWILKFGPIFAQRLRRRRPVPTGRWHLDEMFVSIRGKRFYLWRAVDDEGEVLDILVQPRRDKRAALGLLRKLLRKVAVRPERVTTDKLRSYSSALRDLGLGARQVSGGRSNNRAENSHQPVRRKERCMKGFKSPSSAQITLAAHAATYNAFNIQRHLISRKTLRAYRAEAMVEWQRAVAN